MPNRIYRDVHFEFVRKPKERWDLRGTARVWAKSMSLRIDLPGDRPYVVRGVMRQAGYYSGRHRGRSGDATVRARWRRVGGIWVGVWVEEGVEYVFAFRLTPSAGTQEPLLHPAEEFYGLNPDVAAELPVDLPREAYRVMEEAVEEDIAAWKARVERLLDQHGPRRRRSPSAKPAGTMAIQWARPTVVRGRWIRGHGVEFRHDALPGGVIAFLVGYEWLHLPGRAVRVELLNRRPAASTPSAWPAILDEVREAVTGFVGRGGLDASFRHGRVTVRLNA